MIQCYYNVRMYKDTRDQFNGENEQRRIHKGSAA